MTTLFYRDLSSNMKADDLIKALSGDGRRLMYLTEQDMIGRRVTVLAGTFGLLKSSCEI
jgi:hypothetical protein